MVQPGGAIQFREFVEGALARPRAQPMGDAADGRRQELIAKISPREMEVLRLLLSGHSNKAIGFRLENYDASGAWRDRDGKFPIDAAGPLELKRELQSKSALFVRTLSEKMLTYALGRGLERQDRPELYALLREHYRQDPAERIDT